MSNQTLQIEVQKLSKRYGDVKAVTDVSFSVGSRQVLGFLGPNGAGKTTIMKILTGFHFPSSGKALVDGIAVDEAPLEVKKRIGYLPENVPLYGDLTVDEYLSFAAEARFIPRSQRKSAIDSCLEACALTGYRGRRIETLSKGYRQRAGLAQAILHDPPILILDEPTTGLDPNQIIEIRSLIKELGKRKTVILSTHILQEVEAICSQVLIINEGRIAAQGRPEEIAGSMKGGDTWELILKGADADALKGKLSQLGGIDNAVLEMTANGNVCASFFISAQGAAAQGAAAQGAAAQGAAAQGAAAQEGAGTELTDNGERIFDWAVAQGVKILGMSRKKISIEDIFVKLTSETAQGGKK